MMDNMMTFSEKESSSSSYTTTTTITNGMDDEEEEADASSVVHQHPLQIADDALPGDVLQALNMMRRNRHFCDVILHVGNVEMHAHRAVLAGVSPYLFELFSNDKDKQGQQHHRHHPTAETHARLTYRLNGGLDTRALQLLIEYAYTGTLAVPFDQVKAVYLAASHLKIDRIAHRCAAHLIRHLSPSNCIEMRAALVLPPTTSNNPTPFIPRHMDEFIRAVDAFIAREFDVSVVKNNCPTLFQLACARIEILCQTRREMALLATNPRALSRLVLEWIGRQLMSNDDDDVNDRLMTFVAFNEHTHLLIYRAGDNSLHDCASLEAADDDSDLVRDYKKMALKSNRNNKEGRNRWKKEGGWKGKSSEEEEDEENKGRLKKNKEGRKGNVNGNMEGLKGKSSEEEEDEREERLKSIIKGCDKEEMRWRSSEEEDEEEKAGGGHLIASACIGAHNFLALVTLAGCRTLATLSIQLRLNTPSTPSPIAAATPEDVTTTPSTTNTTTTTPDESTPTTPLSELIPAHPPLLATMSNPRCAVGCGSLGGTLIVCGGYDRIECLQTAEQYDPVTNRWIALPSMRERRGRFQLAIVDDRRIYAIGGSNGTTELDTIEMLDMMGGSEGGENKKIFDIMGGEGGHKNGSGAISEKSKKNKWVSLPKLPLARSNPGVCALNSAIYCVGGWNGHVGIKQCDVFQPMEGKWRSIAPLNIGRYQAGVTAHNDLLYAIGGCDAWNCLSSVERYDPTTNVWALLGAQMIMARRGCGVAVFKGRIYVVGGSDGAHALRTTEMYDVARGEWTVGPSMTTARANVEVTVVGGRLYAVGGFSGKTFLNTIEYLDANSNEWTNFVPQQNEEDTDEDDEEAPVLNGRRHSSVDEVETARAADEDVDDVYVVNGTTQQEKDLLVLPTE